MYIERCIAWQNTLGLAGCMYDAGGACFVNVGKYRYLATLISIISFGTVPDMFGGGSRQPYTYRVRTAGVDGPNGVDGDSVVKLLKKKNMGYMLE